MVCNQCMGTAIIPSGIIVACSGIVRAYYCGGVTNAVRNAVNVASGDIGTTIHDAEVQRNLQYCILHNVANRREYPFELLQRKYCLPVSVSTFMRYKYAFCRRLAIECGLIYN